MECTACGAANRPGRRFCAECGSPLTVPCPACGGANEPGERFCGDCGGRLEPDRPVARPVAAAERRLVSVLFADLVGFTSVAEQRDAEDVRELLSRYFDEAREVIGRFGGTVEKFIGDAVMAVWGTPVAREDDAERAVRAALDIVAAVAAFGAETGLADLRARAAVMTGETAVTIGAQAQGMVAGDIVNAASRAQALAEPGTVLVGDATRRASEAAIAFEDAGVHTVKGKAEPLQVWRALRVVASRRGEGRSTSLEAPFVGRDAELRLVKELFHSAADEHRARLVSVVGVAGIGKSRLSWEFERYLDGLVDDVWWHRGRCLAYGDGVAFWALAEMVRMRARIAEDESSESARAKLHEVVAEHAESDDEREWLEPRLAHLLGLAERAEPDREDLFSAWRVFFERLAEQAPVVLVFEDLQWADNALLEFVEYLLDWSRSHALFVLTLARPELSERHAGYGAGRRDFTSLFLEPLPPAAMDALLTGLVPGLPEELRARILERAEGVPLYAVETVRMLLDRGLLERVGNEYRPLGSIESLEVPETLHALIAARLDGLDPDERRVLSDASVLGKSFTKHGLAALTGLDGDELASVLASLVRKEILTLQVDPRSPERGHYNFIQALVQRVARDTLSRRDRKERHLAAAAFFESEWGDQGEIVEVIAAHYLDAYAADPSADDAGEIKAKARTRLAEAGERANSLAAKTDAQRYFDQAASLADDPADSAELLERAGGLALERGEFEEATDRLERARSLFEQRGRTHAAARVAAQIGQVLWYTDQIETAIGELERAYAVLAEDEPDEDLGALAAELARLNVFSGHADEAARWIEPALDIAERLALPELLSQSLNTKHLILLTRGRTEEATALVSHALALALENDSFPAALRAYFNLANNLSIADRYADANRTDQDGLELARRLGDRNQEVMFNHHLVQDSFSTGDWDECDRLIAEMQELAPEHVMTRFSIDWFPKPLIDLYRGELGPMPAFPSVGEEAESDLQTRAGQEVGRAAYLHGQGAHVEALRHAREAWSLWERLGPHVFIKDAFVIGLEAALAADDLAGLERLLEELAEMAPGQTPPYLRAQSARFAGLLAARGGDHDRAEASFAAAQESLQRIGRGFSAALVQLERAESLAAGGRIEEAAALASAAAPALEQRRARPAVARARRLVATVAAA